MKLLHWTLEFVFLCVRVCEYGDTLHHAALNDERSSSCLSMIQFLLPAVAVAPPQLLK